MIDLQNKINEKQIIIDKFEFEEEQTKRQKNIVNKINLKDISNINGLYDADNLTCIENYLDNFTLVGADPGNSHISDFSIQNGSHFNIHKNIYNDLSHITCNNILLDNLKNIYNMDKIYAMLSSTTYKTSDTEEYVKYVNLIITNWDKIWSYCTNDKITKIHYDTYIHKQKAIERIAKETVNKLKIKSNSDKKLLIAFGKGNGNITVSNTKNSSPKGPVKKLVNELSKHALVVLVSEHNTSQLCSTCGEKLTDVHTYNYPSHRKIAAKKKKKQWRNTNNIKKKECQRRIVINNHI